MASSSDDISAKDAKAANSLYQDNCAACHGASLRGGFGPALTGNAFQAKWSSKGVPALRAYIAQTMPPANPGGLELGDYDRLAAFLVAPASAPPSPKAAKAPTIDYASPKSAAEFESWSGLDEKDGQDATYHSTVEARTRRAASLTSVTEEGLRHPVPQDWLHARRSDDGAGFSPLHQINRSNVRKLRAAWSMALSSGTNEITPLAHDGVIFVNSNGTVRAFDVETGDTLWTFARPTPPPKSGVPVSQARSMAIFEDRIIVPTVDNHMIALDMRTGKPIWDRQVQVSHAAMRFSGGPIVARGKIIQGMSSCNWSSCFVVALDARTGNELWRFSTIAKAGEPGGDSWNDIPSEQRGGGSVWAAGSFDPETGLVYIGTGQTYHIEQLLQGKGERSEGNAALYTNTTLALDPDTGRLVWHYQHIARDVWDLDWAFERILATLPVEGKPRRVVMTMGKLGILDILDAKTGRYLFSHDLGLQTLVTAIDPTTGWKTTDPAMEPDATRPVPICPYAAGVRNWPATSYDPDRKMLYVPITDACMNFIWAKGEAIDISFTLKPNPNAGGKFGGLAAINLATRKIQWWNKFRTPQASAVLSTAGGLVFEGGRDRWFRASDSTSGNILWSTRLDNMPSATPISFAWKGVQYVAVTAGGGGPHSALLAPLTPELDRPAHSTTLWVFRLSKPTTPSHATKRGEGAD